MEPIDYLAQLQGAASPLAGYLGGYQAGLDLQGTRQQQSIQAAQEARAAELQPYDVQSAQLGVQGQQLGLQQGQQNLAASQFQLSQQQQEAARQEAFRGRMSGLAALGKDMTLDDIANVMAEFPEYGQQLNQTWSGLDERRRGGLSRILAQSAYALKNGNTDAAISLANQFSEAAKNSGDPALAATAEGLAMIAADRPDAALVAIGTALYGVDPDMAGQIFDAGESARVQSSESVGGGRLVVQTMTDGTVRYVDAATNQVLTGQDAVDARKTAEAEYAESQQDIYGSRTAGTLESRINLGAEASAQEAGGAKAAQIGQELSMSAFQSAEKLRGNIGRLTQVISAIDAGANTGRVAEMFPDWNAATIELRNLSNQLRLDVVGSVTFGALSENELALAMQTALPTNLDEGDLRGWVQDRIDAQTKLAEYLSEQARFLARPGRTIEDWYDYKEGGEPKPSGSPTQPPSQAQDAQAQPAPSGLDFLGRY